MEDIVDCWKTISITAEEEDVYGVVDEVIEKGREEMKSTLLGRLLTEYPYNKGAFKSTMTNFYYTNFKVQVHSLPLDGRLPEVGEFIGDNVGDLIRVRTDCNGKCFGKFVRVRSRLDISKMI
ncbi:hypothetical protein TIFTF001_026958 [Ficus carica]|uniref:Uncharacterized protein n=1 Tax=Ficus carica TaxID=3494 RepID=A0AA88DM78_FICCA|nr:hypothetical protein TIFTF001_026958 [Ficus carica]